MIDSDVAKTLRRRAMDLLARREYAPYELAQKLAKKGFEQEDIAPVLEQLIEDNLLSASRYAQAMVRTGITKGRGPRRIRADLERMQIDEATIAEGFEQNPVDWFTLAAQVRQKRYGLEAPQDYKQRAKQMRYLQRRGFGFDAIQAAFD